ncbi:hypothetical protein LPB142_06380 [Rhodobacter xanthinilyticus]|uniref:Uncharacterized protein n=1 Tax=Rhodobacter xanthinilyticus TaxID=1850250 RepID=A0A1D9MAZ2_9RHOB|nr:hypothetical protein LPB142_06380 [Rhodobacter xanthinilyticus]
MHVGEGEAQPSLAEHVLPWRDIGVEQFAVNILIEIRDLLSRPRVPLLGDFLRLAHHDLHRGAHFLIFRSTSLSRKKMLTSALIGRLCA